MPRPGLSSKLTNRIQHGAIRLLAALPPRMQVLLSGRPPIRLDGDTLAPEVQLSLAMLERLGETRPESLSPDGAREARRRLAAIYGGKPAEVRAVRDLRTRPDGLRARHY